MNLKQQAAREALQHVHSGMILGLGSGSTAAYFVDMLGQALRDGRLHDIAGVPTSESTAERARALGIPLTSLTELGRSGNAPLLNLAVDGADEVDPDLNLIKGLGRALLREKIIEIHTARLLVIVDESKLVPRLGQGPLPVEIVQFEAETQVRWLNTLGCRAELWHEDDGRPIVTDNGNYLARCWFPGGIADLQALAQTLAARPGIVEHGLFLGLTSAVIVAGEQGIRTLE
jgi:ribose 5-phosphate isomerase A